MTTLLNDNAIIQGHRIAFGVHGLGNPVILIHGTPSHSYIWRNIAPVLVDAGHRVYLFDLLGFGQSERPGDAQVDTSVTAQTEVLDALIDHWGLSHAHLVCHDIGGAIGMRYAIFHPEKVQSLSLIDSVSFDSWPSPRTKEQMKQGLDSLIRTADADHRQHFSNWIEGAVYNKNKLRESALSHYIDMIAGPVNQASFFQHQVRHYHSRHTEEITGRLHELGSNPVQLIWGENDTWQVTDWAQRLHRAIPGSKLTILPECGHFAMEDQPEKIAQLLRLFLAGQA